MPESRCRPDQPGDGPLTGREHALPPAGDPPARQPASDHGAGAQTPPDPEVNASAQARVAGLPPDSQHPDAIAPQDVRDTPGQQEAAAAKPGPGGLPAAPARLAPLSLRLLAFAVDLACVTAALLLPILVGTLAGVGSLGLFALVLAACLITYLTVWVWLTGGQTIGKAMFNLTVRRINGAAPARTWRGLAWSLGRHSAGYLVADVFGLGVLAALAPPRRCLHDYLFGSQVVIGPTDGDQRPWSPVARLSDFDERLEASIKDRGKRYARLVSLWKRLTKLVLYPAMVVIVVAGKNPQSWLGRLWAWVQRQVTQALAQAPSAAARPAKALPTRTRAGLWAATSGVTVTLIVTIVHVLPPPPVKAVVPATADIFAAGQPSVPDLDLGGGTLPPSLTVTEGSVLRFDAAGVVTCRFEYPFGGADGGGCIAGTYVDNPSFGSISGIVDHQAPMVLVGVFTNGRPPTGGPPPSLDFSATAIGHDFPRLTPTLNQVFFIGDGKRSDSSADRQLFVVPRGATHLYLGFPDACAFPGGSGNTGCYYDNAGFVKVTVRK